MSTNNGVIKARRKGKTSRKGVKGHASLTYAQALLLRYDAANGMSGRELSAKYGVSTQCALGCAAGRSYKDVGGPLTNGAKGRSGRPARGPNGERLERMEALERNRKIRAAFKKGKTAIALANEYGLARQSVYYHTKGLRCGKSSRSRPSSSS